MTSKTFPLWRDAIMQASANSSLGGAVKVLLIDAANYTYSDAHQFLSDVAGAAIVATSPALASKTFSNGVFDAADTTFSAVTGASAEDLILYIDTGVAGTSRLVCYIDAFSGGMPVTPNGGDINVTWDNGANKIFKLGA